MYEPAHDPTKVPQEYVPKKVIIEKVTRPSEESPLFIIRLDADGEKYEFAADIWMTLDRDYVVQLIEYWKNIVIPYRRVVKSMTREQVEAHAKSLEGIEV
jgi:hypothetical protein